MEQTSTGKTTSGKEFGLEDWWAHYLGMFLNGSTAKTWTKNQDWIIWTMRPLPWACSCSCSQTDQISTTDGVLELLKNSIVEYESLLPIADEIMDSVHSMYVKTNLICGSLAILIERLEKEIA